VSRRITIAEDSSLQQHPRQGIPNDGLIKNPNNQDGPMAEQTKRCKFCGEEILAVAIKCKHCGSNLSESHQKTADAPVKAKKSLSKQWWFWGAIVVGVTAITVMSKPPNTDRSGASISTAAREDTQLAAASETVVLPADQNRLMQAVAIGQAESRSAENDMQRGGVKAKRDGAVCAALSSLTVSDWVGSIDKIGSNSDGKGVLAIKLADGLRVKTWNNSLSDVMDGTLIEPGTKLFQGASAMKEGQRIVFSGTFFRGREGDCIKEQSLSLRGKIEDPEFVFKFTAISPYLPGTKPTTMRQVSPQPKAEPVQSNESAPARLDANGSPSTLIATQEQRPSWCNKAATNVENMICGDAELASLDAAMLPAYKAALAASPDSAAFIAAGKAWRQGVRDKCADRDCLIAAYQGRLRDISAPRSSPPALPHLDKMEPYTYVRAKMIAAGWKPYRAADADTCSDGDKRCEGRPEMQSCAGTGMANCIFTWSNGQRYVGITTVGEDDPVVDGARKMPELK